MALSRLLLVFLPLLVTCSPSGEQVLDRVSVPQQEADGITKGMEMDRPSVCRGLLHDVEDRGTWDAETDSYARNYEWERCMGVDK